jgi:glycosyltransferase involved in cell wall biosynthesis
VRLGLLPALGGSIASLRTSGQDTRLVDGYLQPYARAFGEVTYFSYAPEALGEYTDDSALRAAVDLRAPRRPTPRLWRALTLPLVEHAAFRRCAVLRSFQVTGVIPALIARRLWGIPFVTSYGFWYARLSRPGPSGMAKRVLEHVGLRRAAAIIVPTPELGEHVARVAGSADRVHLIPNGVDAARFAPVAAPAAARDGASGTAAGAPRSTPAAAPNRIVYVGRLEPEKNLATLLAAAARVGARRPVRLELIGAGSLERALRAEATRLGVATDFAGVIDHRHVPDRLRAAQAFVLPSFTEGHPKVLIEAMAAGLPCVASSCPGNRALVADGETGLLFDPGEPEALAACLERVLGDPALAAALGRRARERVVREYDLGALVQREIALLRSVAAAGGPAR